MSLNRKPIVAMGSGDDPILVLAPALIRDSFAYTLRRYYEAELKFGFCQSDEMRAWHGTKNQTRGNEFVKLLDTRLQELGWKVLGIEQQVTGLLGFRQDEKFGDLKDLGDVDVLAYHEESKRLLAIECKHLHYKKTPGEIAEQLNDYRGEMRQDGSKLKKDELRKHLVRMEVLQHHHSTLLNRQRLPENVALEGWVVFRHPVPMLLCWDKFREQVQIGTYETIEGDLTCSVSR